MKKGTLLAVLAMAASSSFAVELVVNGDFESGVAPWVEFSSGGFALIGDYSGIGGPPTTTAWLGGYDDATDSITQTINTLSNATGELSFTLYWVNADIAGFDFLTVSLGGTEVYARDLGDDEPTDLYGPEVVSVDVSGLLDGSAKDLVFQVTTDGSAGSSAFIDNVSLQAEVVPEPATLAVLGLGLAAMRRRRK